MTEVVWAQGSADLKGRRNEMEYVLKLGVFFMILVGATKMEPIVVGFMLVLYVVPVLLGFAVLAWIADKLEEKWH
jgi:hypothetical protein